MKLQTKKSKIEAPSVRSDMIIGFSLRFSFLLISLLHQKVCIYYQTILLSKKLHTTKSELPSKVRNDSKQSFSRCSRHDKCILETSALITSRSNQLGSKNAAIAPVLRATEDYKSPSALFQTWWLSASVAWNKIILKTEMKEQRKEMQRGKGRALSSMCFVLCEEWQDNGEQSTRRSAQRGEAGRNRDGVKLR